jgi:hypothetical protein
MSEKEIIMFFLGAIVGVGVCGITIIILMFGQSPCETKTEIIEYCPRAVDTTHGELNLNFSVDDEVIIFDPEYGSVIKDGVVKDIDGYVVMNFRTEVNCTLMCINYPFDKVDFAVLTPNGVEYPMYAVPLDLKIEQFYDCWLTEGEELVYLYLEKPHWEDMSSAGNETIDVVCANLEGFSE